MSDSNGEYKVIILDGKNEVKETSPFLAKTGRINRGSRKKKKNLNGGPLRHFIFVLVEPL